jgi:hypothetical protein
VRVELLSADATELRPDVFRLARDRGWTLWELHKEKASLEQLFRDLTSGAAEAEDASDEGGDVADDAPTAGAAAADDGAAGAAGDEGVSR